MSQTTLRITESRAVSYRIPASGASNTKHVNYAVALTAADSDGRHVKGSGEATPGLDHRRQRWQLLGVHL